MVTGAAPSLGPLGEVTCVAGQTFCLSAASGQILPGSDQGVYIRDTRVLSMLVLRINGAAPTALGGYPLGPGAASCPRPVRGGGYWSSPACSCRW